MKTFKISEIYKTAWSQITKNFWFLTVSTLVFGAIYMLFSMWKHGLVAFFFFLVSRIAWTIFSIGMIKIAFDLHKGLVPNVRHFETDVKTFFRMIWAGIITVFFCIIGFVLLIVPGIIVAMRLSLTYYIIIDKNMSSWQAIKESWELTRGYSWKIFGLSILSGIIILISIIPFGLGLLVSIPFVLLSYVGLYLKIKELVPQSVSTSKVEPPMVEPTVTV